MKQMRFAPIAGVLFIAFATAAPAPAAEVTPACVADAQRFCPHETPGSVRQSRCLTQHKASLQLACKRSLAEQAQAAAAICQPDIEKFCATVQSGGGRLGKCLMPHKNELSPRCKSAVGKL
jgi:hypothetical protein